MTKYFVGIDYTPKYELGDRVFGYFEGVVPFIGTVGVDRCLNGIDGEVVVRLDLPFKHNGTVYNVVVVPHKDIKPRS